MELRPGRTRFLLIFSMFVMGACGLMYEYVLSVQGNHLMGTSHEQMFIIIGLMLFAMGIGSLLQRFLTRNLLDAFLILEILLGLLGGYGALIIYQAYAYSEAFPVILYGCAGMVGVAIGMEIPLLIRINDDYAESLRANLSEILSVDYIGSLVGAFLFTFVLLSKLSLARIGFVLGMTNAAIGAFSLFYFRSLVRFRSSIVILALVAIPLLIVGFFMADDWTLKAEQRYYQDPIIFHQTTRFQHIVVTRRDKRVDMYLNGNLQFSSLDEAVYHEYLVHVPMAVAAKRDRVLILGGGDGLALREVLKYPDVKSVRLVDIDPEVIRIASTLPELIRLNKSAFNDARVIAGGSEGIEPGQRVKVYMKNQRRTEFYLNRKYPMAEVQLYFVDADRFISDNRDHYDVVIIDFPDPSILELAKLFSLDFFRSLRRRLNPQAVISMQSTSPFFAREAYLCIGKTMEAAGLRRLPYHGIVPSFAGDWGWYLGWVSKVSPREMRRRFDALDRIQVATTFLTPDTMRAGFIFGKGMLKSSQSLRINTKMRPVLVEYYRRAWKGYE